MRGLGGGCSGGCGGVVGWLNANKAGGLAVCVCVFIELLGVAVVKTRFVILGTMEADREGFTSGI